LCQDTICCRQGEAIVDWLNLYCLEHSLVVVSQPILSFPATPSMLDFFLGSSNLVNIVPEMQNFSCQAIPSDSDHHAIQLNIRLNHRLYLIHPNNDSVLLINRINWNSFKENVESNIIRPPVNRNLSNSEIDTTISSFENVVRDALNIQKVNGTRRDMFKNLPESVKSIQKHRQHLRKKLQRILHRTYNTESAEYKTVLAELRCTNIMFKEAVRHFRNAELTNKLERIKPGPDAFKQIGYVIGKKNYIPEVIYDGNKSAIGADNQAESFADYFEKKFNDCPPTNCPDFINEVNAKVCEISEYNSTLAEFSDNNPAHSPTNMETFTDQEEVIEIIQSSKAKKSSGSDGISNFVLRKLPNIAFWVLAVVFNNCLNNSYFPTTWKEGKIVPVPKKSDRSSVSGYRPISLLCCISKIFESLILKSLNKHIVQHDILPKHQFGFVKGRSTIHPLIKFHNDITAGLNKKEYTVACFLDVENAFDSVWHNGLIFKLFRLGFCLHLVKLILDFLKNRQFFVQIADHKSSRRGIAAGVPQGSKLGPIIFNLFSSDQPPNCARTTTLMYADDSCSYSTSIFPALAMRRLQHHINQLWNFYHKWGLKINANKSTLVCFRVPTTVSRKPLSRCRNLSVILPDGSIITPTTYTKYLGILFNELFKFNEHARNVLRKAKFALNLVNPLLARRCGLNKQTKLLIYKQLIRPVICYGCPIWFTISPTTMEKINILERQVLRRCTGLWRQKGSFKFIPNHTLYESAKIQPIEAFMSELSKRILSSLAIHPDITIRDLVTQEVDLSQKYLSFMHLRNLEDDFYRTSTSAYHRG
jgi:hypothetical protein